MGLWLGAYEILLIESRRKPFEGRLLTLGRQDFAIDPGALRALRARRRLAGPAPSSCAEAFADLGFTSTVSLDASDFEGAQFVHDLNSPSPPAALVDYADTILDSGTIEHVFHVPNALSAIYSMLKVGGRVIHITPASNYIDHGFYSVSPTLFRDWYLANGYRIELMAVIRHSTRPDKDEHAVYRYTPRIFQGLGYGGVDGAMYTSVCVATKLAESTADRIPQQGFYVDEWQKSAAAGIAPWRKTLRGIRPLYRVARWMLRRKRIASLERLT